jgi:predicted DNA-binding transcriptional regulator AlpA
VKANNTQKPLADAQTLTVHADYQPRFDSEKEINSFLNEKQVLARILISRRTLFNWRESGKIPHVKIGRRNLFHWPSVEAALLRQQRGGGEWPLPGRLQILRDYFADAKTYFVKE